MKPMPDTSLLGIGGTFFLGVYLCVLILIGVAGRRARRENSMADFFLGGRKMGLLVLFLTLYATQYSGNTLIGYAGAAYRQGFRFLVSVTFMMSIIGGYLIFAPKLHRLSKKEGFITLGDFLQHRYRSQTLTIASTVLCIFALANYILSNLKAMGYLVEGSTGGRISFAQGILVLSLIMVIYETLGGLRSVAWTDVMQGVMLLAGCVVIFVAMEYQYGGLSAAADRLLTMRPDFWQPPDAAGKRVWLSTLAIIFLGVPVYPQAIQRIYAARNENILRRSLQLMVFMPLVTTFFIVVVGIVGASQFPGLDRQGSEGVALRVLSDIAVELPAIAPLIVLFLFAVVAAIMSTVDSALLAISSSITQDLYRPFRPQASQERLTSVGKRLSWLLMAALAYLATVLPQTIWRLTEIKLELLCQVSPALLLGIHSHGLRGRAVLAGMVSGTAITLILMVLSISGAGLSTKPLGVHSGIWGLGVNLLVVGIVTKVGRRDG